MKLLKVIDRPRIEEFSKTLSLQTNLLEAKIKDRDLEDTLILVEHEPVYTVGRSVPFQTPSGSFANIPWREVGRGGQATFHGPGQLVAYPLFNLEEHGKDVHVYLRKLEEVLIDCLSRFGIKGERREGFTGVWVQNQKDWKKVASIGVGVRRWVSSHGIALNVSTNLQYFKAISPCGESGDSMTTMSELLDVSVTLPEVKRGLVESFLKVFGMTTEEGSSAVKRKRPNWLKAKAPHIPSFEETRGVVDKLNLVTVCEEARCPNIGECWSHHTATFMIMGELCTRRCGFCSVMDGNVQSLDPLDSKEPYRVGKAVSELGLKHVVITSVNRDDLPDMGAGHFHQTIKAISKHAPDCDVELLIPDMRGARELLEKILESGLVKVLNHNLETVPRLYRRVRPGANFQRSLDILCFAKDIQPSVQSKSGIMVGLGETRAEILSVMDRLREVNCNILTIGQYLQPTQEQLPIARYVTPEEFEDYRLEGLARGFSYVESGPLVRSSYHAWKHSNTASQVISQQEVSLT